MLQLISRAEKGPGELKYIRPDIHKNYSEGGEKQWQK